jgi:hypothetical protein
VREPGDDMIAMVSYVASAGTPASTIAASYAALRASDLVHDVLVSDNDVSGNYWGRGITVVGGENVTIQRNRIANTAHAAAIYIARETAYMTFGVKNVDVHDNVITDVEVSPPPYVTGSQASSFIKTWHGGIEVYTWVYTDEAANPMLADAFAVQQLNFANNTIDLTLSDGIRIGGGSGSTWSDNGRTATGGRIGKIDVVNTAFNRIGGVPLNIVSAADATWNVMCSGNTSGGNAYTAAKCSGSRPAVTGTTYSTCAAKPS